MSLQTGDPVIFEGYDWDSPKAHWREMLGVIENIHGDEQLGLLYSIVPYYCNDKKLAKSFRIYIAVGSSTIRKLK